MIAMFIIAIVTSGGERDNAHYQGIDTTIGRNATKLRLGAGDGNDTAVSDAAIADVYRNRFYIPLDFELLESHMPFYQSALGDRLEYELTFNDYYNTLLLKEMPMHRTPSITFVWSTT